DEVAFVESLFAPEMRSAVAAAESGAPSMLPGPAAVANHPLLMPPPLGSLHALASPSSAMAAFYGRVAKFSTAENTLSHQRPSGNNTPTVASAPPSGGVPPPPNSLLGGGIFSNAMAQYQLLQAQSQQQSHYGNVTAGAMEDAPLFVRLNVSSEEDDVIGQLLGDQDFADFHGSDKKDATVSKPPSSSNSLLLEPLDLPRSSTLDQSFKDTFLPLNGSPMHYQQQYRAATPCSNPASSGISRGGILSFNSANASPTSGGFYTDSPMMPVFPLSSSTIVSNGSYYGYSSSYPPPLSSSPTGWVPDSQNGVSTPVSNSFQRMHAAQMSTKHMMLLASMNMSSPMAQHQEASAASGAVFNPAMASTSPLQHPTTPAPLWISASKLTPPEAPLPANASERKRATRTRSKARRPMKPSARTALALSLNISPPASLTNCDATALKELIVSADHGTPPTFESPLVGSRAKRSRSKAQSGGRAKTKAARTDSMSVGDENSSDGANAKVTKGKKCVEPDCTRRAQSNSRCKAHGGGARCQYTGPGGCTRSSQGGGFCRAHGGGKRCEFPGCLRGQQRKGRCYVHGGIRKCQCGTCEKKDRGNGFCISHGGGKRCEHPGCSRAVRRGVLCQLHEE
ncbi:hypothetical protein BBJ28_00024478, partial [Nothophytophthora sp. Chile5]